MAAIRGKNTKPEMVVRRIVHRLGYRFRLHSRGLPGKPDLVFARIGMVINVHGCFWHMHNCPWGSVVAKTNADFWLSKRSANAARDRRDLLELRRLGWRVLTLWECETKHPERLTRRLIRFLSNETPATQRTERPCRR